MKKFLSIFLSVFLSGYILLSLGLGFEQDISRGLAKTSYLLASPFDSNFAIKPSSTLENILAIGREDEEYSFFITITEACNAVSAMLLLIAGLIAYPSSWRSKLITIAIGSIAIQAVNVFRLISLVYVGYSTDKGTFDFVHENIWPVLIYLVALACFVISINLFSKTKPLDAPPN